MNNRKHMLNEFDFSSHICTNSTINLIETIEMILDKRLNPFSKTIISNFNDTKIKIQNNGDIAISGLKNKSDLQKPFINIARYYKEVDMSIFQNRKYDLLVEYTNGNKQLFENMTLEKLFQTKDTDKVNNIKAIYDIGVVSDLTLLAWKS